MSHSALKSQTQEGLPSESRSAEARSSNGGIFRRVNDLSDQVTEWVIWFMVIFSPWAFGTTQEWAMGLMNAAGYALGVLFATRCLARRGDPSCLESQAEPGLREQMATRLLGGVTILLLAYCLVSALNARCIYLGDYQYKYFPC